jgi:hypothetical protein
MVSPSVRFLLCLLVGLFAGSTLGVLFVPDPTGLLAGVMALAGTAVVTGVLYRSEWLRG